MCFRCGSEDHFIANFPTPDTSDKKVHWKIEKPKTRAYKQNKKDNTSKNSREKSKSHKIYASMAHEYSNVESPRRNYGDSSQLTDWILDSGVTCHITPDFSDFILGQLVETDKYIELAYGMFRENI